MCNLGEVYLMKKENEKGEQMIADALSMFKKTLKPEDMRVLITADNLAEIYSKHGKLKEAEDLQRSIIITMEKVVGKGVHPDLVVALNNLAQTLYREKKYPEAETNLKRCIEMNKAIYGDKHPKTVHSISAYTTFLEKTGRKEEADKIIKQLTAPAPPTPPAAPATK
jgi:tetratricopeptide (TPR) repeat protein